jgi:hypothetical protein
MTLGKREPAILTAILLELLGFHGGLAAPGSGGAPRRGGEPRLEPAPAPRHHAGCPIPIPGGHPGCRGCRRDVGCTDVSATHIERDVDCSRGAEVFTRGSAYAGSYSSTFATTINSNKPPAGGYGIDRRVLPGKPDAIQ